MLTVDSAFSSIMLEKCLVSLEKCSVLLENIFKSFAQDRLVIARNFPMLEMLDHFFARDRSDRKFKIKYCARDRSDRKFQCSKCSRSMFLQLGLNSIPYLIATRHAVKVTNFSFQTMQDFNLSIQKYFGIGYGNPLS